MNEISNTAMPVWRKIEVFEKKLVKHPANRESAYSSSNPTPLEKEELREIKKWENYETIKNKKL